jgi:peptide/nickel transport system permease protein
MIPIVVGVIFLSFVFLKVAPGDYFDQMALDPQVSKETLSRLRAQFGLDQNVFVQFIRWFWNALHLNFGYSFEFKAPVFTLIWQRSLNTLILSLAALIISWTIGLPIGIYSAVRQYSIGDKAATVFAFVGLSIPNYILAFLIMYFSYRFGIQEILPIGGVTSLDYDSLSWAGKIWDRLRHLIIPAFVLGTSGMAGLMRIMRGNMLEVLRAQYIITARSKGLMERLVVLRHATRNAINPIVTILGYEISGLLSGAVLVESVTSWPGLGRLTVGALLSQDYYLTIGSILMSTVLLIFGNLMADILLSVADPRIQFS